MPAFDVTVRFFAGARESAGVAEAPVRLSEGDDVAHLKEQLLAEFPHLSRYRHTLLFAVGEEYVAATHPLRAGDVVSCFPPVSGG